ncbi:MAG: discoidin domain-containing protein, partial [Limisphaerales bacterium]
MKIKLLLCLALVLGESAFAQQSSEPSRGTNSKNFVIPGFVIAMPSDSETGEEWWMPYTKPLEISRYVDIEDISSLPGIITILRYSSPEEAKRAYQESFIGRPQAPEPLKAVHWDAAHEWTKVGVRGTTDMYLLKGDYLVGLYGLPPFCPAATIDKLLETLAGNIVKAETSGPANGNAVTEVKLKFVRVDSEETNGENGYGKNAVDGDPNTYWHTQWQGNSPGLPHEIVLELVPPSVIHGFTYLPRQDLSDHGTIKDYELYASDDGTNFNRLISKGAFGPGKEEQMETFEPIKCRFIKLKAISEINGLPWTSAAEIGVIPVGENTDLMTNRINRAIALLAEFQRAKSTGQLEKTFRAVEKIPEPGVDKSVPEAMARREKAIMWFTLLAVIDQNIDTNFDVNNPINWATVELAPPGPEGWKYPSGVSPNDIKEPEVRAQYEAALKQNEEKARRELFQSRLRNIDQLATREVERFLRYYTTSKKDQSELDDLMKQAKLSPARIQKIKALFDQGVAQSLWNASLPATGAAPAAKDAYVAAQLAKLFAGAPTQVALRLALYNCLVVDISAADAKAGLTNQPTTKCLVFLYSFDNEAAARSEVQGQLRFCTSLVVLRKAGYDEFYSGIRGPLMEMIGRRGTFVVFAESSPPKSDAVFAALATNLSANPTLPLDLIHYAYTMHYGNTAHLRAMLLELPDKVTDLS